MVVGTLRGFDQFMNLVLDGTVEVNGNERNEIGMVVGFSSFSCRFQIFQCHIKLVKFNLLGDSFVLFLICRSSEGTML